MPSRRTATPALLGGAVAVLLATTPGVAPAQLSAASLRSGVGISQQHYRFSDADAAQLRSISLLIAPFAVRAPIVGGLRLDIAGAWAQGRLERQDGSTVSLSGPTDTQVRLAFPVAGELLTLTALVTLPTGVETPTAAEAEVAGAIASDLLPFRISNWGGGGGAGGAALLTHSFGAFGVGAGASYQVSREFAPVDDPALASYRPGDQLTLQLALSRNVGRSERAALQVAYTNQTDDQLEGTNLYRSGDRIQAIGSYAFRLGRTSSGIVYAGGQHRQRGAALLEITRDSPSQSLGMVGGGLRLPLGSSVVSPSIDFRLLRSADGVGQGYLGGIGAAAEWQVGRFTAGPQIRVQAGDVLIREGTRSNVLGGELGLTVSF